jgi:hypothetical protein
MILIGQRFICAIKKRRKGIVSDVLQQTRQRKFKEKESSYLKETELSRSTSSCKEKKKIGIVNGVPQRTKQKKIK